MLQRTTDARQLGSGGLTPTGDALDFSPSGWLSPASPQLSQGADLPSPMTISASSSAPVAAASLNAAAFSFTAPFLAPLSPVSFDDREMTASPTPPSPIPPSPPVVADTDTAPMPATPNADAQPVAASPTVASAPSPAESSSALTVMAGAGAGRGLRVEVSPPWREVERLQLSARSACAASISEARALQAAALRQQVRSVQVAALRCRQRSAALAEEARGAREAVQARKAQTASLKELHTQLQDIDRTLLALLRRRRTAVSREQNELMRRVQELLTSASRLDFELGTLAEELKRSVQQLRDGVFAEKVAQEQQAHQEERILREEFDGHLPKLVLPDPEQLEAPRWGEIDGWGPVEACVRYTLRLRGAPDASAAGRRSGLFAAASSAPSGVLKGPFQMDESPPQARLVRVRTEPFGEGAMRHAYLCEDVTACPRDYSRAVRLVAKESRWAKDYKGELENRREFYAGDACAQLLAQLLVQAFNDTQPAKLVQMLTPVLYEFPNRSDSDRRFMLMELSLLEQGAFARYTNNDGFRNPSFGTMMALSHWTHAATAGRYMLCDLQGVEYLLTDPQVHSLDDGWGQGNLGQSGMDKFFESHWCNKICKRLGLKPHPLQPRDQPDDWADEETVAREQYTSKVIGPCGHVYELAPNNRRAWFKEKQRVPCAACISARVDPNTFFFA